MWKSACEPLKLLWGGCSPEAIWMPLSIPYCKVEIASQTLGHLPSLLLDIQRRSNQIPMVQKQPQKPYRNKLTGLTGLKKGCPLVN